MKCSGDGSGERDRTLSNTGAQIYSNCSLMITGHEIQQNRQPDPEDGDT